MAIFNCLHLGAEGPNLFTDFSGDDPQVRRELKRGEAKKAKQGWVRKRYVLWGKYFLVVCWWFGT